jgi:hypothetical protein
VQIASASAASLPRGKPMILGFTQAHVLFDRMFVFFALYERKKDKREKGSTALPKANKRQLRKS